MRRPRTLPFGDVLTLFHVEEIPCGCSADDPGPSLAGGSPLGYARDLRPLAAGSAGAPSRGIPCGGRLCRCAPLRWRRVSASPPGSPLAVAPAPRLRPANVPIGPFPGHSLAGLASPVFFHPGYGASAGSAGAPSRGIPCGGRLCRCAPLRGRRLSALPPEPQFRNRRGTQYVRS
jgi:hypothetical protein